MDYWKLYDLCNEKLDSTTPDQTLDVRGCYDWENVIAWKKDELDQMEKEFVESTERPRKYIRPLLEILLMDIENVENSDEEIRISRYRENVPVQKRYGEYQEKNIPQWSIIITSGNAQTDIIELLLLPDGKGCHMLSERESTSSSVSGSEYTYPEVTEKVISDLAKLLSQTS